MELDMRKSMIWIGCAIVGIVVLVPIGKRIKTRWDRYHSMHAQAARQYYEFHKFDTYLTSLRQNICTSYIKAAQDLQARNTNAYAIDYSNAEYFSYALEHAKW